MLSTFSSTKASSNSHCFLVGKNVLDEKVAENVFKASNLHSGKHVFCKVFPISRYVQALAVYFHLPVQPHLHHPSEIILGHSMAYIFFEHTFGNMYRHVQSSQGLCEDEALRLFHQIVSVVAHCHNNGVVLPRLKLKNFAFKNKERTELALCTLKGAYIIEKDDFISGKHSCPLYISPESLQPGSSFSGKASNVWILGVILYTILVGSHPFTHTNLNGLYRRIQKCKFFLPELLSPKAKCLICSILRKNPTERLTAEEILSHPWFSSTSYSQYMWRKMFYEEEDQKVPSL
ncbi:tribbles homolog 2-like [Tachysurus vachellii]|uniref:tribbles homolog 2-like n=1 Tax=Tachysurus vachellii TaxID=175792 RepID=UPI00296AFEC0|nr:tribbles homolog 2-like [Tachysurus vachellii]